MKIDRDTALMAMGLHETMLYADALHMEKDKLNKREQLKNILNTIRAGRWYP